MRSWTTAEPSSAIVTVSLKSATRQDLAKREDGQNRNRISANNVKKRLSAGCFSKIIASIASELHRHRLAVGIGHLEELARLESEHARQNIRGEGLYLRIQVPHHRVVVATGVLDGVFHLAQR